VQGRGARLRDARWHGKRKAMEGHLRDERLGLGLAMADGRWPMADGRWPMADGNPALRLLFIR